jgi:hypothetical protein
VLSWIALALAATAVAVPVRWAVLRVDALGRVRPFPVWGAVIPAALAVICAVPVLRHHLLENRLSSAASRLVGTNVRVHCQSLGESFVDAGGELGYVRFDAEGIPEHATTVKASQCSLLSQWLSNGERSASPEQVVAVHVITHESMHMTGTVSESRAECSAVQRDSMTARLLGATPREALSLARRYYTLIYPNMPDEYRDSECAAGGTLDEHLPEAPWSS